MDFVSSIASTSQVAASLPVARLSRRQTRIAIAVGIALWLVVALVIRATPAVLFERGPWTIAVYLAAWPNALLSVWIVRHLAALSPHQLVNGSALACAAAMLCDGVALTWTELYQPGARDVTTVGAVLLWGVAAILLTAMAAERRLQSR